MSEKAGRGKKGLVGITLLVITAGIAGAFWLRSARKTESPQPSSELSLLSPNACARAWRVLVGRDAAGRGLRGGHRRRADPHRQRRGWARLNRDRELAQIHLDIGRLRAILLTHVHGDHSLGAQQLRHRTGAKVYAGRADRPPLRAAARAKPFQCLPHVRTRTDATTVDVELAGDEILSFGDVRIQVIATPGHTPGSVCYLLERPGLRAIFTGDVVSCLVNTEDGSLGTYTAYLPPRFRGDAGDYLASLRRFARCRRPISFSPAIPIWINRPRILT